MSIKIIRPVPGMNTRDLVLVLVRQNPQGITVKQLSERLNRPVSMIDHCLKYLVASKKILARKENNRWIYRGRTPNAQHAPSARPIPPDPGKID